MRAEAERRKEATGWAPRSTWRCSSAIALSWRTPATAASTWLDLGGDPAHPRSCALRIAARRRNDAPRDPAPRRRQRKRSAIPGQCRRDGAHRFGGHLLRRANPRRPAPAVLRRRARGHRERVAPRPASAHRLRRGRGAALITYACVAAVTTTRPRSWSTSASASSRAPRPKGRPSSGPVSSDIVVARHSALLDDLPVCVGPCSARRSGRGRDPQGRARPADSWPATGSCYIIVSGQVMIPDGRGSRPFGSALRRVAHGRGARRRSTGGGREHAAHAASRRRLRRGVRPWTSISRTRCTFASRATCGFVILRLRGLRPHPPEKSGTGPTPTGPGPSWMTGARRPHFDTGDPRPA